MQKMTWRWTVKEFSRDTVSETESFSNTQWLHITALILCFLHVSICLMLHSSGRNKVCLVLFGKASSRSHSVGAAPSSCADAWPFQGFHVKPFSGPFSHLDAKNGRRFRLKQPIYRNNCFFVRDFWSSLHGWPAALRCSWPASPVRMEEIEKWLAQTGDATCHEAHEFTGAFGRGAGAASTFKYWFSVYSLVLWDSLWDRKFLLRLLRHCCCHILTYPLRRQPRSRLPGLEPATVLTLTTWCLVNGDQLGGPVNPKPSCSPPLFLCLRPWVDTTATQIRHHTSLCKVYATRLHYASLLFLYRRYALLAWFRLRCATLLAAGFFSGRFAKMFGAELLQGFSKGLLRKFWAGKF